MVTAEVEDLRWRETLDPIREDMRWRDMNRCREDMRWRDIGQIREDMRWRDMNSPLQGGHEMESSSDRLREDMRWREYMDQIREDL